MSFIKSVCSRHFVSRRILLVFVLLPLFRSSLGAETSLPVFVIPQRALYGGLGRPEDPVPSRAALRTGTLPNGLRYYILENSLPADRAYLTLAVNAGSVLEEEDEQGLAHFVEHMAFSGTRRFPGAELINYLRSLGMRFGPEVNAYTSYDETVYGIESPVEKGPDGIKRIPEKALAILDDWTWTVSFNPPDADKERGIILEEYRTRLGAQERIRRQMLPVIFHSSRYAVRFPIGLPEIIQQASAEKLRTFYQTWYRPDNMALVLVGDFDGAILEKELASHFTAPAPEGPLERPWYELPDPQKGLVSTAIVSDPELPGSTVYLYHKRSPRAMNRTLEGYREGLIDSLVSFMTDFRSEEEASMEDAPYIAAGSWNSRFGRRSRYYITAAQAKTGKTAGTLESLLLEKERLLRYGFTTAELDRAKGALLSALEMMESEKDRRESEEYVMEFTADFLNEELTLDPGWEMEAAVRMLPGITLETVNKALVSYYADDDLCVLIAVPEAEGSSLPSEDWILKMVKESREADVDPPEERAAALSLGDPGTAPGKIVAVQQDDSGAEIWELGNGMRIILMETANKNNELDIYALARGGTMRGERDFSAELAAEIQGASGLGPLSRPGLMDFLAGKQVSFAFGAGAYIRTFRGSSTIKDLSVLFQMFHVYFTQVRLDQTGLKLVLDQYRTSLAQEADNPESVFTREITRVIYSGDPLFRPMELEDLDGVDAEEAAGFLAESLNPADYTLVLAGSLSRDGKTGDFPLIRELTETWLASIPRGEQKDQGSFVPAIRRPEKSETIVHKGREEKSIVYMGWFVPKTWTEEGNAAALVLGEYLDIVLTDEIREALGGVYSISAGVSLSPMPVGELALGIYFVCDPKREGELREAVRNRIDSLALSVDEAILNRAKEALVKTFERSMENNGFVARNLANFSVITGIPLSHLASRPVLYRSIGAEMIQEAVKDLLAGGPVEVVLLPESAGQ
ncbi:MAG: insulinase family protein [Treponema sp.]|jgi:zinc protease|nr:insulinase family protein [Treponema sp.]